MRALLPFAFIALPALAQPVPELPARLAGHAVLPALTLIAPPADAPAWFRTSGRFTAADRRRVEDRGRIPAMDFAAHPQAPRGSGVSLPVEGQPVQGLSGVRALGNNEFLVLTDNGYGSRVNSPDTLLMVHRVRADFSGRRMELLSTTFLRDPDRMVPFAIRNEATAERYLTGADFDPESIAVVGDRWFIGDEFGPYLIEAGTDGRVRAVHETRVGETLFRGPDHFTLAQLPNVPGAVAAPVRRSRGFEPMGATPDGTRILAAFEGPLVDERGQPETHEGRAVVRILEFDVAAARYTGRQFRYALEEPGNVLGDLAMIDANTALVIERDDASQGTADAACQGAPRPDCFHAPARFKRVYRIDLSQTDAQGFVRKLGFIDLTSIADPEGAGGALTRNGRFAFPFLGPEGVALVDSQHIAIVNDNNFPFSVGRALGRPDDNELILLHVPELLGRR